MVTTSAPSACTASMVQDFIARPFTWTTQAPHWLVSQPTWVPVSRSFSRSAWTSNVWGWTSTDTFRPLTFMVTVGIGVASRRTCGPALLRFAGFWNGPGHLPGADLLFFQFQSAAGFWRGQGDEGLRRRGMP